MIPLRDLNPRRTAPVATVVLIALNVLFFLYELALGEQLDPFLNSVAFVPGRYFAEGLDLSQLGEMFTSATLSMFLHGGWMHLIGNMLFLWIFGDNVEDRLGHLRFILFYLLAGYAAFLAQAWADPQSDLPSIGASGAISGVLGAYLLLYPRARIVTLVFFGFFFRLLEVPALVFLPFWFLLQFISGVASLNVASSSSAGGVAWFAHVGGFITGLVLLPLFGGLRPPRISYSR
jgi:membrane associated rhomboid family serine protease